MPGISPHRQQQQQQYHRPHLQMTGQETSSPGRREKPCNPGLYLDNSNLLLLFPGYPPSYKSPQPHHPQMMSMVNSHHMGQQQQQQQHNMHLSQMQHMQQHPQQMGHLMGAGSLHEPQIPHYMNPQVGLKFSWKLSQEKIVCPNSLPSSDIIFNEFPTVMRDPFPLQHYHDSMNVSLFKSWPKVNCSYRIEMVK